ncbi:MAG: TonB-dependent receptor domain-containing protein [Waterburya sp.]
MKQKLSYGIVLNFLVSSILFNVSDKAYGTPKPKEFNNIPATTVEQWQAQLNNYNSVAIINNIVVQSTPQGIQLVLNTSNGKRLRSINFEEGNNLIIDIANAKLQLPESQFIRQNPIEGISKITAFTRNQNQTRVVISGVKETPIGDTVTTNQGLTINAQAPVPLAETTPPDQVIDIIVTAQKKPEKLKSVPISLTTLSEEEIKDGRIDSFRDVAANTPNFFTTVSDRAFNFQTIRGLGNANFLSRDSISFYIDDVPYENVHQLLPGALFDLERVEILRGPQSTLYGRNSQAGVINVISRQPTNFPEITLGASYGNFNQRQLQFSASDAVIKDKLKFRIAGIYDARDGFTENNFLNDDANNLSSVAGRANLVWTPSDKWNIAFNATGATNRDGDNTYVPIEQEDPFETELDIPGNTDLSINTQSLRIGYKSKEFNLTSITARNGSNLNYNADGDYTSEDLFEFDSRQETTIVSQEIRLQSPDNAESLGWIVGGYFQDRSYDLDPLQLKSSESISVTQGRYDQTTFAGFGQIDFKPVEPLTLTAGLRYENSDEELSRRSFDLFEGDNSGENTPFINSSVDDEAVIPKFAIEYSVSPNIDAYGSITRGYKPPTQNYFTEDSALRNVEAEKSWNYEVGIKSSWLSDRLSVNVAGFINDVSNFQVALAGDTGFFEEITNAEVLIKGLEIEAKAKPLQGLDLIAGFGYTDAEYTDYVNPFTGENFEGNQLLYTPEFTLNLAAQYRTQFGLFTRVELQGLGNYFFDDENSLKQDSLALVNARVGYEAEQYGIYLFVNNLFDQEYLTSAFFSDTAGRNLASYGDRRTFGIQVSSEF